MTQTLCPGDGTASLTWQVQGHLWESEYYPLGCKQMGFQEWETCPGLAALSAASVAESASPLFP